MNMSKLTPGFLRNIGAAHRSKSKHTLCCNEKAEGVPKVVVSFTPFDLMPRIRLFCGVREEISAKIQSQKLNMLSPFGKIDRYQRSKMECSWRTIGRKFFFELLFNINVRFSL